MEEKKYIQLEEVIDVCQKFINKEITQKELEEWGNTIEIQLYIPIVLKGVYARKVVEECLYSDEIATKITQLEMNKFWYVLLKYTNIYTENEDLFTIDNYDILYPVIGYWLKGIVQYDYDVIIGMIEQMLNYGNVLMMSNSIEELSKIDLKALSKSNKEIQKLLKEPELVKDLASIMQNSSSQEMKEIINAVQKEVLKISK